MSESRPIGDLHGGKSKPLAGLTVLDLGPKVAGAFCCKFMAMLGAEVIKVEKPSSRENRDEGSNWEAALRLYIDTCKKSVTLNLGQKQGSELFLKLVERADVVVHGYSVEYLLAVGLASETLRAFNKGLVITLVSDFGSEGPYKDFQATPIVHQALGGFLYLFGDPTREPLMFPGQQSEYQAGLYAYIATLAALMRRSQAGSGCNVEVVVQEAVTTMTQNNMTQFTYGGTVSKRRGIYHGSGGFFPTKDGMVSAVVTSQEMWQGLFNLVGKPELISDPRFDTRDSRSANHDELDQVLREWFQNHTTQEAFSLATEKWRVPLGKLYHLNELPDDPQLKARDFFVRSEKEGRPAILQPGLPFKMSTGTWEVAPAPDIGDNNHEIYQGRLGLSEDALQELQRIGVV